MTDDMPPWMESFSMPLAPTGEMFARLSGLPEKLKRQAWSSINQNKPELAILLRDPLIKQIIEAFDAELFVDAHLVPELPVQHLKGRKQAEY